MAGGKGSRMKSNDEKLLLHYKKPLILHVIDALEASKCFDRIVVVTSPNSPKTHDFLKELGRRAGAQARDRPRRVAPGQRGQGGLAGDLRSQVPDHWHDRNAAGGEGPPAPAGQAGTEPGTRRRYRLLVQRGNAVVGFGEPQRGRHGDGDLGQSGHRRLARVLSARL